MATKTRDRKNSTLKVVPNATDEQTTTEQQQPQPAPEVKKVSVKEEREALKAAGLKRCPTHAKYFDRLPDEAKVQIPGYPPEVRKLEEFFYKNPAASMSSCKACDRLMQRDYAASKKNAPDVQARTRAQKQARVEKLTKQMNALADEINRIETELRQEQEQRTND